MKYSSVSFDTSCQLLDGIGVQNTPNLNLSQKNDIDSCLCVGSSCAFLPFLVRGTSFFRYDGLYDDIKVSFLNVRFNTYSTVSGLSLAIYCPAICCLYADITSPSIFSGTIGRSTTVIPFFLHSFTLNSSTSR